MATRLVIDVALTEEDLRRDPIEVVIPGLGSYQFPGVINALAQVRVARWESEGRTDDTLAPAEVVALLGDLVPDDVLRSWSNKGFNILDPERLPALEKIVMAVLAEYQRREGLISAAGGDEGKATPPTPPAPPPYSGTGPS